MYGNPYNAQYLSNAQSLNFSQQQMMSPSMSMPSMQQTMQAPQEQRRSNADFIPVSNIQQVREHIVQPNQMLYFMNNNVPEFYIKSADNFGTTQLKAYSFTEINPDKPAPSTVDSSVISRDEFEALKAKMDNYEQKLAELSKGDRKNESDYANDDRRWAIVPSDGTTQQHY